MRRTYEFKVKLFDIEAGLNVVVLNEEEAHELDIYMSDRIALQSEKKEIIGIVDLSDTLVKNGEIGLFEDISKQLSVKPGDTLKAKHVPLPSSVEFIKKKMDGKNLEKREIYTIISELMENKLSSMEIASFLTSAYIRGLTTDETAYLTEAIVSSGDLLNLNKHPIVDKHCSGGVAGNRTTMVIVPMIAAAGLYIPKTSSRSITSAAGTADVMEVLADVTFTIDEMRDIVLKTYGCIVWGGAINLASADDRLIKIRNSMRLDPKNVLIASILAKKRSVGAEYVAIDIPIGRGAKIENLDEANSLANDFLEIGKKLNMKIKCFITDGSDPIGDGIGPILECRDVFAVLQGGGPKDLMDKSCQLAGALLELSGKVERGRGYAAAMELLKSGKAYKKMKEIIEAQGGDPKIGINELQPGAYTYTVKAEKEGKIELINSKLISKIARAAGAPKDKGAGILLHCEHGDRVEIGDTLFEIFAESESKLSFAVDMLETDYPIELQKIIIKTIYR